MKNKSKKVFLIKKVCNFFSFYSSDAALIDDQYSMYSVKVPNRISRNPNQMYDPARWVNTLFIYLTK